MKKVLLTGATGFIGRHCLPLLKEGGFEVHAVSSKGRLEDLPADHWYQADLLDSEQASDLIARVCPTHLLHLAWFVVPGAYWTSPENFRWIQASLNLLEAFSRHGGQRVVVAGTCAEYDWAYGYCSEQTTPLLPENVYGICKHALQILLDAFAEQAGIGAAWGRIFFLYGPHEPSDKLVASVVRSVLRGEPAPCSHGNQIRDFLYVKDVASAFVSLLQSDVRGVVNIASGLPVSLKDVVNKIGEKLNRADLIRLGERPVSPSDPPLLVADARRLTEEVGWMPEFDLDVGLDQTIQWWDSFIKKR